MVAGAPFPPDLVEQAQAHAASSSGLKDFFEALARSPHASRLHAQMIIPARGPAPAITLCDLANRTDGGSVTVLGDVPAPACMQCAANLPQQPLRRGCFRLTTVSSLRSSDGHACGSKAAAAARCRPARYRLMRQKRVGVQPSGAYVHVITSCYHASHVTCCTSQAIVGVTYYHTLIALTLQLGAGGDEMMEVQSTACMHFCSVAATRRNSIALAAAAIGRQAACCSRYSPLKRKL